MNLKQLQAFVRVTEQQSFTKAAQNLYLTQPAISWQIKSLENALGVTLLERHDRQVFLTEAGRLLLPYARQIVALAEEMLLVVAQFKGLQKGRLRIGASTIPGEFILPFFLGAFLERYPALGLHLEVGDTAAVLQWVRERAVDFGVVGARPAADWIEYLPFLEDELVLILPPGHPLAAFPEVPPEELKRYPMVMRESGSGTRAAVAEKLEAAGVSLDELRIVLELGSTRAVVTGVKAGLGLSIVSRWAVQETLASGHLLARPLAGLDLRRQLYLAIPAQVEISPAARAFKNFLLDAEVQRVVLGPLAG